QGWRVSSLERPVLSRLATLRCAEASASSCSLSPTVTVSLPVKGHMTAEDVIEFCADHTQRTGASPMLALSLPDGRVRVLGEFPPANDETVIPLELVLGAVGRNVSLLEYYPVWGVDVARF